MENETNERLKKFLVTMGLSRDNSLGIEATPRDLHLHPDVYQWLWFPQDIELPRSCKTVFLGCAALQNRVGEIFALGFGTVYILRTLKATEEDLRDTASKFSKLFPGKLENFDIWPGKDWIFGRFSQAEKQWLLAESRKP